MLEAAAWPAESFGNPRQVYESSALSVWHSNNDIHNKNSTIKVLIIVCVYWVLTPPRASIVLFNTAVAAYVYTNQT